MTKSDYKWNCLIIACCCLQIAIISMFWNYINSIFTDFHQLKSYQHIRLKKLAYTSESFKLGSKVQTILYVPYESSLYWTAKRRLVSWIGRPWDKMDGHFVELNGPNEWKLTFCELKWTTIELDGLVPRPSITVFLTVQSRLDRLLPFIRTGLTPTVYFESWPSTLNIAWSI